MRNPVAEEYRIVWGKAGIWMLVFVLLAWSGSNLVSSAAEILPKAREYKISLSAQEAFTVEEALKNEEELAQAGITVYASQKAKLTGKNGVELSVTQTSTDDRYADVYGLSLLRGTYFVSTGLESMDRFAVISDKASLALFQNLDAVGHEIQINQTTYTVVGVYEPKRSLLCDLSSDGMDTVFIPISSQASIMGERPVNLTEPLQTEDGAQDGSHRAREILGAKLAGYQMEDLTQAMRVMEQTMRILWFVVGITGCLIFLRIALGIFVQMAKDLRRKKMESTSFWTGKRVAWLLLGVGMIAATGIIWRLVSFSPYIPSQYLPKDNIFDLQHYWQQFLSLVHTRNASITGYDFYGNAAFYGILLQGILLPLSFFSFFACILSIRKAAMRSIGKDARKK